MDHPSEAGKGERRVADAYANRATDVAPTLYRITVFTLF